MSVGRAGDVGFELSGTTVVEPHLDGALVGEGTALLDHLKQLVAELLGGGVR
jgi:hypothetical protein